MDKKRKASDLDLPSTKKARIDPQESKSDEKLHIDKANGN